MTQEGYVKARLHFAARAASARPPKEKLSGIIEADECYIGGKRTAGKRGRPGPGESKAPVFGLVERGGSIRAFPVERVTAENLQTILKENAETSSRLMTDELNVHQSMAITSALTRW